NTPGLFYSLLQENIALASDVELLPSAASADGADGVNSADSALSAASPEALSQNQALGNTGAAQ
ncbi:MAG: hypothetical protein ACRDA8_17510, partial [Shewanella sp.]